MLAHRLRASVRASRIANCAVGGHDLPVFASGTMAQSPSAQSPRVTWHRERVFDENGAAFVALDRQLF